MKNNQKIFSSALFPMLFVAFFVGGCGVPSDYSVATLQQSGQRRIVNGGRSPKNTFLTEAEGRAIGYIVDKYGFRWCSGTIVHPWVVATATHCFQNQPNIEELRFRVGPDMDNPEGEFAFDGIVSHESVDFTALILHTPATDFLDLQPIALNSASLSRSWRGLWVDAAGFGVTRDDKSGLFFASVEIINVYNTMVAVDGHGREGLCFGDSGGPVIWQANPQVSPVVLGVETSGDESCVDHDFLTRTDIVVPWLREELKAFRIDLDYAESDAPGPNEHARSGMDDLVGGKAQDTPAPEVQGGTTGQVLPAGLEQEQGDPDLLGKDATSSSNEANAGCAAVGPGGGASAGFCLFLAAAWRARRRARWNWSRPRAT